MAKNNRAASTVVLCLILVSASVPASAREEGIRLTKCEACKKVAEQLYNQTQDKQAQFPPQNITKEDVVQITNACNLEEEEANSTPKNDTVEQGDKSKLADQGTEGTCDAECKTMQEACNEVKKGAARVSDYLNEHYPDLDGIVRHVCEEATTPCESKRSPAAEGQAGGKEESRNSGWSFQTAKEAGKRAAAKGFQTAKEGAAKVKGLFQRIVNGKPGSKENSKTDKSEL